MTICLHYHPSDPRYENCLLCAKNKLREIWMRHWDHKKNGNYILDSLGGENEVV
jgi:hypothetical protein